MFDDVIGSPGNRKTRYDMKHKISGNQTDQYGKTDPLLGIPGCRFHRVIRSLRPVPGV